MEFRRQQLPGMEQRANTKMPGRLRDQLDIFQNKIISATETGFSSRFFHMLKFLSPSSLAAAVQGTQLYRATGSTFAYLWQKADEKSCELTNHNPSVIKHLENRAWHGEMKKQEQSSLLQALQQSGISYRKSNYKQIPSVVELSPRLSAPFSSSLTICSSGTSFYWPNLSVSSSLLLSSWQSRQKVQDIQGKKTVRWIPGEWLHHQVDPNNLAVYYYYYYRFLSRLTLRWILHNSCVSGHLERRMFGSWASVMLGAQEQVASLWTIQQ